MMSAVKSCHSKSDCVVEAVDWLESHREKADQQNMINYLMKKYRIKSSSAKLLINKSLAEGIVLKVSCGQSICFKTPLKLGQMLRNRQNHIILFNGSQIPINAIRRVIMALSVLSNTDQNLESGLTVTDLLEYLHKNSQLLNYDESLLERLLTHAIKQGHIDRLDSGAYILSAQCKLLETSQIFNLNPISRLSCEMEKKLDSKEENTIPDGASLLVNQSITVTQKRQKKSTAPVLQRIRPISKRKKFKKSLGPDFLEPQELGMQYLRDSFEPKCDICSLTMFSSSNSLNVYEDLLHCNNCDTKAHPSCLNLSDDVAHKTQWQCMACKACSVCQLSKDNEFVIICMKCSKGYHVKCHISPIIDKPKGNWYCKNCCSKSSNIWSNGTNEKKMNNHLDQVLDESEYEFEVSVKEEKDIDPVDDNEMHFDSNEKKIENCNNCFDETKEEQLDLIEKEEETNHSDFLPLNVESSKSLNFIKDKSSDNLNYCEIENKTNESISELTTQKAAIDDVSSPQKWSVTEVESFIKDAGFPVESKVFRDQEIDGRSLLLLRRMDVLTGLSLKLGPALKIYNHIMRLQGRDHLNNY